MLVSIFLLLACADDLSIDQQECFFDVVTKVAPDDASLGFSAMDVVEAATYDQGPEPVELGSRFVGKLDESRATVGHRFTLAGDAHIVDLQPSQSPFSSCPSGRSLRVPVEHTLTLVYGGSLSSQVRSLGYFLADAVSPDRFFGYDPGSSEDAELAPNFRTRILDAGLGDDAADCTVGFDMGPSIDGFYADWASQRDDGSLSYEVEDCTRRSSVVVMRWGPLD